MDSSTLGGTGASFKSDQASNLSRGPYPRQMADFTKEEKRMAPISFPLGPPPCIYAHRNYYDVLCPMTLEDAIGMPSHAEPYTAGRSSPSIEFQYIKSNEGKRLVAEDKIYTKRTFDQLFLEGALRGKRILLLGSGSSKMLRRLFDAEPARLVCVDTDPRAIETVKRMVLVYGVSHLVDAVCHDATDFSFFQGNEFDTIVSIKSMGCMFKGGSEKNFVELMKGYSSLLKPDGTMVIDNQTISEKQATYEGNISGIKGLDYNAATICGRYDDSLYWIGNPALPQDTGLELIFNWNPVPANSDVQNWTQFWFKKTPEPILGHLTTTTKYTRPILGELLPRIEDFMGTPLPTGIPQEAKGSKIWMTQHLTRRLAARLIYPKFDGITGSLYLEGSVAQLATSLGTTHVRVSCKVKTPLHFLCEVVPVKIAQGKRSVAIITGLLSCSGVVNENVHDLEVLNKFAPYAKVLSKSGILITSPYLLQNLKRNSIRLALQMGDINSFVELPVDGLNVPLAGVYGNFLKPSNMATMDIIHSQLDQLPEELGLAANADFTPWFDKHEWAEDEENDQVWEYASDNGGRNWCPTRKRDDKQKTASFVRAMRDFMGCAAGYEYAPHATDVALLYKHVTLGFKF